MAQSQINSETSLTSSWQARLHYWEATLSNNPSSPVAWRWRIQIKILGFLLSRYPDFESTPIPEESPAITVFDVPEHPAPPKSDLTLRRSLFHIAKLNGFKPYKVQNTPDWPVSKTRGLSPAERFVFAGLTRGIYNPRLPRWLRSFCFLSLRLFQSSIYILPLLLPTLLCGLCALLLFICLKIFP